MTEQELQAIKERVENATLGDWIVKDSKVVQDWYLPNPIIVASGENGEEADYEFIREEDAEFIAHARQDVPALIAEVERLRGALGKIDGATPNHYLLKNHMIADFKRIARKALEGDSE